MSKQQSKYAMVLLLLMLPVFIAVQYRFEMKRMYERQHQRNLVCNCLGGSSTVTSCWLDTGEKLSIEDAQMRCNRSEVHHREQRQCAPAEKMEM